MDSATDISSTERGKLILGAISSAEDQWRRVTVRLIADKITTLPPREWAALKLRLQSPPATWEQIGKLIDHTAATARTHFKRGTWRLKREVWIKLYQADRRISDFLFYKDDLLIDEIRAAMETIPLPQIPPPSIPLEERCRKLRAAQQEGKIKREQEAENIRKRWTVQPEEYKWYLPSQAHAGWRDGAKNHLYGKIQKVNCTGYRVVYK